MKILTVCSVLIYILSGSSRTSAWDPEQRLLQVFGCFCSYLSTVEHRVSNLKATMHYALVMVSITAFVCHAVIRKSDIEVASNSYLASATIWTFNYVKFSIFSSFCGMLITKNI